MAQPNCNKQELDWLPEHLFRRFVGLSWPVA